MHIVIGNEVADVDLAEFDQIGFCRNGVIAVPQVNVSLTIKGMRASNLDRIEDYQNTVCVFFEAPSDEAEEEQLLLEDPFVAGIVYRRQEREFVELKYEHRLGILMLHVYFLIDVNNCAFGYQDGCKTNTDVDYTALWALGFIGKAKS